MALVRLDSFGPQWQSSRSLLSRRLPQTQCDRRSERFTMGVFTRSLVLLLFAGFLRHASAAPPHAKDEYDYIVVGSGPGGGPLAANLARAKYSVLLIEAGDLSLPGPYGQDAPQVTWDFFVKHYEDERKNRMNNHLVWKTKDGQYWVGPGNSTPPKGAEYLGIYYPRGATVGGSSMINAMCVWLPPASDWDYIADLTGDKSWRCVLFHITFTKACIVLTMRQWRQYAPDLPAH